jgi:hypothetical protein
MRLDDIPFTIDSIEAADRWQRVLNQLNSGDMPPDGSTQPQAAEKVEFLDVLSTAMAQARRALADSGGRITMRRLNRREYDTTLRQLLGVEIDVRALPADTAAGGFDTSGSALFMSSEQFKMYRKLAREALDDAFQQAAQLHQGKKQLVHVESEDRVNAAIRKQIQSAVDIHKRRFAWESAVNDSAAWPENVALAARLREEHKTEPFKFPRHWAEIAGAPDPRSFGFADATDAYLLDRGWESITVQGAHYLSMPHIDKGMYLGLNSYLASCSQHVNIPGHWPAGTYRVRVRCGATDTAPPERRFIELYAVGEAFAFISSHHVGGTIGDPGVVEFFIRKNKSTPGLFVIHENSADPYVGRLHSLNKRETARNGVGIDYAIWIDNLDIEGPIEPPEFATAIGHVREVIKRLDAASAKGSSADAERTAAREVITGFTERAFRGRPPAAGYVDRLVSLYEGLRSEGQPPVESIKEPLAVILASPRFLYLAEPSTDGQPRALTDLELATRLSYFLWGGPPDETLLSLARDGTLKNPSVLAQQVDRMIADDKVWAFTSPFVQQWLTMSRLDFFQFDKELGFDPGTKEAARSEVIETFTHLLQSGGSLSRMLQSDSIFVNALLASFYGLDGVAGDEFREVSVPAGSPRGGLLGMAAILAMGSDGTRSSPVERGAWVLRKLVNDPPPPAPPNVPELARIDASQFTPRERLRMHQQEAQCAQCHRKIDPVGFGLENFDAVGRWRTAYTERGLLPEKAAIDSAGAFHNGPAFKDFFELRRLIASQPERFARGFAEAVVEYAMGRPVGFADEQLIDEMVASAASQNFSVRDFLQTLVASRVFRNK